MEGDRGEEVEFREEEAPFSTRREGSDGEDDKDNDDDDDNDGDGDDDDIERFQSRGQHTCKFTETKGSVYLRKEFNSQRIGLEHQHGRRFIVLEHQYGCGDVM